MARRRSGTLTDHDYRALAEFRYLLRQFLAFSEAAARAAGLTARQHQALLAIKGFTPGGKVGIHDLAAKLGIQHHSAVGLLDRLVSEKWVTRHAGHADRRQVEITLTARGEQVLAQLAAAPQEQLRRIGPEISGLLDRLAKPFPPEK